MFKDALTKLEQPGAVGVLPADTIYGLVARAADEAAVAQLYSQKKPDDIPGTIIAASVDQLVDLGLKARYLKAVEQYWPGAVSVIIPCGPELEYLHLGKYGLPVQIPANKELVKLLEQTGPLLTSEDNLPSTVIRVVDDAIEVVRPGSVNINEAGEITHDIL